MANDTVKGDTDSYIALWYAVLERAVADACGIGPYRRDATEWILSDESSFNWVCDMLHIDPQVRLQLRRTINAQI